MKILLILSIMFFLPCTAMDPDKWSQNSQTSGGSLEPHGSLDSTGTAPTEPYDSLGSFDSLGSLGYPGFSSLSEAESQGNDPLEGLLLRIQSAERLGILEQKATDFVKEINEIFSASNAQPENYDINDYTNNERIVEAWDQHSN